MAKAALYENSNDELNIICLKNTPNPFRTIQGMDVYLDS
jgi:hypothetical protein